MIHFRTAMIVPIIIGLIYIVIVVIAVIVANISITIIIIIVFRKLLLSAISLCHSQFLLLNMSYLSFHLFICENLTFKSKNFIFYYYSQYEKITFISLIDSHAIVIVS